MIALLEVWASYAYVNSIIGNTTMFPLVSSSEEKIQIISHQQKDWQFLLILSITHFFIL